MKMQRRLSTALVVVASLFATLSPASACRCWVGSADTTDQERIEIAKETLAKTYYAVVGRISADASNANDDENLLSSSDAAIIFTETVLSGDAPAEIHIPSSAGRGVYDGKVSSNLLGTCPMSWRDGERNVWLLLKGDDENPVLASSCAHSLVREWLFPEFSNRAPE